MYGVVDVLSQWQIRHWVWGLYVEDSPVLIGGIGRLQQVDRRNKPRLEAIVKRLKKMADHGCPTYDDSYFMIYFIFDFLEPDSLDSDRGFFCTCTG